MSPLEQKLTLAGILFVCWVGAAVTLRAAIALTNGLLRTNQPADKIKTPTFGWSMIVSALVSVPWLAGYFLGLPATRPPAPNTQLISFAVVTPISVLLIGGILTLMIRVKFLRGVSVAIVMIALLWTTLGLAMVAARVIAW